MSDSKAARVNGDRSDDQASGCDGSVGSQLSNAAVWVSPSVRSALRISLDNVSVSGNAADQGELAERIHPQDVPPLCMLLDWAAATPNAKARLQLRLADDGGKWVATVARISADDHGGAGLTIDLDGAVVAQRAEEKLRQIVEGAMQAAVVHVDRKVVYSNPALAHLLGYASVDEMRARGKDAIHVHPDDRAMVSDRMAKRMAGEDSPDSYEFRAIRTDGSAVWLECFASRITWNGEPASLAWLLDISERKRTEEALRQSERLFSIVFKTSPAMLALSRLDDGRFIDANDSFLRGMRLERAQVIGRSAVEIGLFAEPEQRQQMVMQLEDDRPLPELIVDIRTGDGELREHAVSARAIRFNDMDLVLSVGRDVTERLREEAELRRSQEQAEYANRAKSQFLANMSHELRTPLNAIIGFSEVIADELFGPVGTPLYAEYAHDIADSGKLLLQIINDLLDLSKLEAGRQELHEQSISLPQLVEDVIRLVTERATVAGLPIVVRLPDKAPTLLADERMLKQILINLMSNAIKFTRPAGHITLSGRPGPTGSFEFSVADTGIGMTEEQIEIALSPFGQVDNALSRSHQGTGLGLPLVRSLAELHGGTLAVESMPGCGTTVSVTLPPERVLPAP